LQIRTTDLVVIAIFIALIVVLGYLFIAIPNVEMVTTSIFLSGYLLGTKKGLLIGMIAELLYSVLNPYGVAAPPLLMAQVISMGIVGFCGGVIYKTTKKSHKKIFQLIQFGAAGMLLTMFFDTLTTLSFAVFLAETSQKIIASVISSFIYGLPFYITHIAVNTLLFVFVLPLLITAAGKIDYFKPRVLLMMLIAGSFLCISNASVGAENSLTMTAAPSSPTMTLQFSQQADTRQALPDTVLSDSSAMTIDSLKVGARQDSMQLTPKMFIFDNDTAAWKKEWQSPWCLRQRDIHLLIYKDFGQLLTTIPGIYAADRSYPGQISHVWRQGLPPAHLAVLFEGRPLKDPHTNTFDLNLIPTEYLQSIQVAEGMYAAEDEHVILMESEHISEGEPYSRVFFHKGPSAYSDVDVTYNQKATEKVDAALGFTIRGYSGPVSAESYEQHIARVAYNYRYSPNWRFQYKLLYNRMKVHPVGPLLSAGTYATPDARFQEMRYDHTLTLKGSIFGSYYQNFIFNLYYSGLSKKLKDETTAILTENSYRYLGIDAKFDQKFGNHNITTAATLEYDQADDAQLAKHHYAYFSLRFKDDWRWNRRSGLRGKINIHAQTDQGIHIHSGLGIYTKLLPSLKSSIFFSQYFRQPTLTELYAKYHRQALSTSTQFHLFQTSNYLANLVGNNHLKPESLKQLAVELQYAPGASIVMAGNFYLRSMMDRIAFQMINDSTTTFTNADQNQYVYGADWKIQWNVLQSLHWGANISSLEIADGVLEEMPTTMLGSYLEYHRVFFKNDLDLTLKLDVRYWGARWNGVSMAPPASVKMPENWVMNCYVFANICGAFKSYLSVENLLDREYQFVHGYPMNGRTIHYGLRWEFWE